MRLVVDPSQTLALLSVASVIPLAEPYEVDVVQRRYPSISYAIHYHDTRVGGRYYDP
jgi:hypothetical protein